MERPIATDLVQKHMPPLLHNVFAIGLFPESVAYTLCQILSSKRLFNVFYDFCMAMHFNVSIPLPVHTGISLHANIDNIEQYVKMSIRVAGQHWPSSVRFAITNIVIMLVLCLFITLCI